MRIMNLQYMRLTSRGTKIPLSTSLSPKWFAFNEILYQIPYVHSFTPYHWRHSDFIPYERFMVIRRAVALRRIIDWHHEICVSKTYRSFYTIRNAPSRVCYACISSNQQRAISVSGALLLACTPTEMLQFLFVLYSIYY